MLLKCWSWVSMESIKRNRRSCEMPCACRPTTGTDVSGMRYHIHVDPGRGPGNMGVSDQLWSESGWRCREECLVCGRRPSLVQKRGPRRMRIENA